MGEVLLDQEDRGGGLRSELARWRRRRRRSRRARGRARARRSGVTRAGRIIPRPSPTSRRSPPESVRACWARLLSTAGKLRRRRAQRGAARAPRAAWNAPISRFSSTVISGEQPVALQHVHEPERRRSPRRTVRRCGSPSRLTSPPEGRISPLTARRRVVLPWPFGPMMTATSPGSTVRSRSRMTVRAS